MLKFHREKTICQFLHNIETIQQKKWTVEQLKHPEKNKDGEWHKRRRLKGSGFVWEYSVENVTLLTGRFWKWYITHLVDVWYNFKHSVLMKMLHQTFGTISNGLMGWKKFISDC